MFWPVRYHSGELYEHCPTLSRWGQINPGTSSDRFLCLSPIFNAIVSLHHPRSDLSVPTASVEVLSKSALGQSTSPVPGEKPKSSLEPPTTLMSVSDRGGVIPRGDPPCRYVSYRSPPSAQLTPRISQTGRCASGHGKRADTMTTNKLPSSS